MDMRIKTTAVMVGALSLLATVGCLERNEKITVRPDGGVVMDLDYKGDIGDFTHERDALPGAESGWDVEINDEKHQDDRIERQLTTHRVFEPGAALPDSYAGDAAALRAIALRFPTSLEIEQRPDGTYYHFRRVYLPRERARYEYHRAKLEEAHQGIDLTAISVEELDDEKLREVLTLLRDFEMAKQIEFVREGVASMGDAWPQDFGLRMEEVLRGYFQGMDVAPVQSLLREPQSDERDAQIDAYAKQMLGRTPELLKQELSDCRVDLEAQARFLAARDAAEQRYELAEDLGDEQWKIELRMPGELVAHNSFEPVEDGVVRWEFGVLAMMDRAQVLAATSRAPAKKAD